MLFLMDLGRVIIELVTYLSLKFLLDEDLRRIFRLRRQLGNRLTASRLLNQDQDQSAVKLTKEVRI